MASNREHQAIFDPHERAADKQRSRDADEHALATGEKTPAQLRLENSHFRVIAHEPIQWHKTKRLA
jgi:hypothetical protein